MARILLSKHVRAMDKNQERRIRQLYRAFGQIQVLPTHTVEYASRYIAPGKLVVIADNLIPIIELAGGKYNPKWNNRS